MVTVDMVDTFPEESPSDGLVVTTDSQELHGSCGRLRLLLSTDATGTCDHTSECLLTLQFLLCSE